MKQITGKQNYRLYKLVYCNSYQFQLYLLI